MYLGKRRLTGGLSALAALGVVTAASAQATYQVTIQAPASVTTLPAGTMVFSLSGGSDARAAIATISGMAYSADYNHSGYTTFGTAVAPTGVGAGTISNDTSQFTNGFATNATPVGRLLVFTLTFSGVALHPSAPLAATGSDFDVELLDGNGNALWTPDPQGRVLDISLNPDGSLGTPQYFGSTVATVVATPEPSACGVLGAGAALLLAQTVGAKWRSRRRA